MQRLCFLTVVLFCSISGVRAQYATPIMDSVYASQLNEQRKIEIVLPANYNADTSHYDVWYVPDGEWNTHTFSVVADYLFAIGFAPRIVVVGVHNKYGPGGFNYRGRDFTPVQGSDIDSSGGADRFLSFFEKELIPYINRKYRTSGECGIFGSSLGGVFCMYALLQRSRIFRYYALADPAFQFAAQYINTFAERKLKDLPPDDDRALNIGGRSGVPYNLMGRDVMDSVLKKNAPTSLHWRSAVYDEETHISSVFKSNYDGLKFAYLGYSSTQSEISPTAGIVVKEHPVQLFMPTEHSDIHYTTDGLEPTRRSPKFVEQITIADPDRLQVKSFSSGGQYDRLIRCNLHTGYFQTARPLTASSTAAVRIDSSWKMDGSGLINGFVPLASDGYYVFQFDDSRGTTFSFNDSVWISGKTPHAPVQQTIIMPLRKGHYSFRLERSKSSNNPPRGFGLYYSRNGLDNWSVVLRW